MRENALSTTNQIDRIDCDDSPFTRFQTVIVTGFPKCSVGQINLTMYGHALVADSENLLMAYFKVSSMVRWNSSTSITDNQHTMVVLYDRLITSITDNQHSMVVLYDRLAQILKSPFCTFSVSAKLVSLLKCRPQQRFDKENTSCRQRKPCSHTCT